VVQVAGIALEDARPLPGVASFGTRPAVERDGRHLLEVHLLDWTGDAYGKLARVEFQHKIREEAYFESLDALRARISDDVGEARAWFAAHPLPRAPAGAR
jgi:riboflavin kinase/FMN adenylyltransferase